MKDVQELLERTTKDKDGTFLVRFSKKEYLKQLLNLFQLEVGIEDTPESPKPERKKKKGIRWKTVVLGCSLERWIMDAFSKGMQKEHMVTTLTAMAATHGYKVNRHGLQSYINETAKKLRREHGKEETSTQG